MTTKVRSDLRIAWATLLGVGLTAAGCGGASEASYDDDDYAFEPTPGEASPYPGGDDLPDEEADSFYRAAPAVTDHFVYVVNPDRDTLSKINADTRAVYTLPVGAHPTQVLVGGGDTRRAAVLNEADATLTLLDTVDDTRQTVPIHPDTNFMALRDDGLYAITHFSRSVEGASTDINGVRSYSSISVVFTGDGSETPTSTPLTVGLNPRSVTFVAASDQALVLCDEAVALVELSPEPTARLISLTDDPDEALEVDEIKVSPDGRYAYLRTGRAELLVVDLTRPGAEVERLSLGGVPSDMELSGDRLILVDRANRQLMVYDPFDPFGEPEIIPTPANQLVGSVAVAPEVGKAILYTTLTEAQIAGTSAEGTPLNRFSVWDLDSGAIRVRELVKPVAGVSLNHNPDLPVAVFTHDGDAASDQSAFDRQEAFTQYFFEDGLTVPAVLEAPMRAIADSEDGRYAFMILEETLSVVVIDYQDRQMTGLHLQSEPAFVGLLTGSEMGWVSQRHELGRLSFVDPGALTLSTITGFELNAQP